MWFKVLEFILLKVCVFVVVLMLNEFKIKINVFFIVYFFEFICFVFEFDGKYLVLVGNYCLF